MALQIKMVKAPDTVPLSGEVKTFDDQGGTLGRADKNTWVLADPDRFLSSCHCEIICEAGHYFVVDLSTNGTFFNGSPEPLGKGSRASLSNGDSFEVGDYSFQVILAQNSSSGGPSPFGVQDVDSLLADLPTPFADPFADSNPFVNDGLLAQDLALTPDAEITDPLQALDNASGLQIQPKADHGGLDDLFGQSQPRAIADPFSGSSYSDDAGVVNQSVSWPEANLQSLIPDDWDDDLLGGSSATTEPMEQAPFPPAAEPAPAVVVPKPAVAPKPTPVVKAPPPAPPSPVRSPEPSPIAQPPEPVATKPTPVAEPARAPTADDHGLIAAMGLDPNKMSSEQIADVSREVGLLMREVVDGMMQILRSRASIKNEFRMNVTTIQPVENNPLKFSADVDEALDNMFVRRSGAYKKAGEAFREGFQEVGEHQVAMIAGIRHGFESMMARFDPDTLEAHFNKQSKGSVIPAVQKAKHWSNYSAHYKGYVDNMESSFQHLFGSDFVDAYEAQLRQLLAARRKGVR